MHNMTQGLFNIVFERYKNTFKTKNVRLKKKKYSFDKIN